MREIKLRKIGNSRGVIIPSEILMRMDANDDTILTITVSDNGVATLEKKKNVDPFARFRKFAEVWNNCDKSGIEHVNKEITVW